MGLRPRIEGTDHRMATAPHWGNAIMEREALDQSVLPLLLHLSP
jgi:hypothetical protein